MRYLKVESFTILGIGGKGAYYIAKFLLLLHKKVYGFDLQKNERTDELEKLGAVITYHNSDKDQHFDTQSYIYSNDLPQRLQETIHSANKDIDKWEVGELYHQIVDDYENNNLNDSQLSAFRDSCIAPLYEIDQSKMKYIAVTGTDGKTTTSTMIYHLLLKHGLKPALVTTVSAKIGSEDIDTGFHTTTPTSQEIFKLIKKAEEANCTHFILETTSFGLAQGRVMGLKFDAVAYTNITEEHLDYHKTWENLLSAKALLITRHSKDKTFVILNRDDERSYLKLKDLHSHFDYSRTEISDIYATDVNTRAEGISFVLNTKGQYSNTILPILGEYNVSNFLAAAGVVYNLENIPLEEISSNIQDFETIKGRMEVIQTEPFTVIVDYAHTPNALEEALSSARKLTNGRLIHVFGSAGHRDFYKRPSMGAVSNKYADITIITAEDPRLESLKDINDQIEKGWRENDNGKSELIRFDDDKNNIKVREDAISKALSLAKEGDLVIITGKAHENSLCFGQTEYSWNDIEETKKLLAIS